MSFSLLLQTLIRWKILKYISFEICRMLVTSLSAQRSHLSIMAGTNISPVSSLGEVDSAHLVRSLERSSFIWNFNEIPRDVCKILCPPNLLCVIYCCKWMISVSRFGMLLARFWWWTIGGGGFGAFAKVLARWKARFGSDSSIWRWVEVGLQALFFDNR